MFNNAVILLSGGLDSTTLLYSLLAQGKTIKAISFDYGQKHKKELVVAAEICKLKSVDHKIVSLEILKDIFSASALMSPELEVPEGHYTSDIMKITVVPNRNMLFLSIAIAWAINLKFNAVTYAAHAGDHTIYPDCRPEFVQAMQSAARLCDWQKINLFTPFVEKNKAEIVKIGSQLNVPFEKTWSCYKGGELHCGKCGTCVERREAFKVAEVEDFTKYISINEK